MDSVNVPFFDSVDATYSDLIKLFIYLLGKREPLLSPERYKKKMCNSSSQSALTHLLSGQITGHH